MISGCPFRIKRQGEDTLIWDLRGVFVMETVCQQSELHVTMDKLFFFQIYFEDPLCRVRYISYWSNAKKTWLHYSTLS